MEFRKRRLWRKTRHVSFCHLIGQFLVQSELFKCCWSGMKQTKACQRRHMMLNFSKDLGIDIIRSPLTVNVSYCSGVCFQVRNPVMNLRWVIKMTHWVDSVWVSHSCWQLFSVRAKELCKTSEMWFSRDRNKIAWIHTLAGKYSQIKTGSYSDQTESSINSNQTKFWIQNQEIYNLYRKYNLFFRMP